MTLDAVPGTSVHLALRRHSRMPEAALDFALSHNNCQRQGKGLFLLLCFYKEQLNPPRVPPLHPLPTARRTLGSQPEAQEPQLTLCGLGLPPLLRTEEEQSHILLAREKW